MSHSPAITSSLRDEGAYCILNYFFYIIYDVTLYDYPASYTGPFVCQAHFPAFPVVPRNSLIKSVHYTLSDCGHQGHRNAHGTSNQNISDITYNISRNVLRVARLHKRLREGGTHYYRDLKLFNQLYPPRPGWPLRKRSAMTFAKVSQHAFLRFFIMSGPYMFNMLVLFLQCTPDVLFPSVILCWINTWVLSPEYDMGWLNLSTDTERQTPSGIFGRTRFRLLQVIRNSFVQLIW